MVLFILGHYSTHRIYGGCFNVLGIITMQNLYIIHNQDGYFLGKSGDWLDGSEPTQLFRTLHKDEAVNQLFEANSKDVELRLSLLECPAKNRLIPDIPSDKMPPPMVRTEADNDELSNGEPQLDLDTASQ